MTTTNVIDGECSELQKSFGTKIDVTVEMALNLGVIPGDADQNVRVPFFDWFWKKVRVVRFMKVKKLSSCSWC